MQIFESVPNISEGRDTAKIEQLVAVIRSVENVRVIDYSLDPDHNRSVITYIGTKEALKEASVRLINTALMLFDIREHAGVHPRMGIVDVMPFIPVHNATMDEAVALSYEVGEAIVSLGVPVYYYEYSARVPSDRNLAEVRRSRYNVPSHKTAGAICVGARDYLVAYNVNIDSNDISIAKAIAAQIREAQSGLRGVKALGMYLPGVHKIQVSMNLTAPLVVGPEKVYAWIKHWLKGAGMAIATQEELIGVMPSLVIRQAQQLSAEIDQKIALLQKSKANIKEKQDAVSAKE